MKKKMVTIRIPNDSPVKRVEFLSLKETKSRNCHGSVVITMDDGSRVSIGRGESFGKGAI